MPEDARARTNRQLTAQMRDGGCSPAELRVVRDAYLLGMRLHAGMCTGSGKTTLALSARADRILRRLRRRTDLAAAAGEGK